MKQNYGIFYFLLFLPVPFFSPFIASSPPLTHSFFEDTFAKSSDTEQIDIINSYGSEPGRGKTLSIADSSTTGLEIALE